MCNSVQTCLKLLSVILPYVVLVFVSLLLGKNLRYITDSNILGGFRREKVFEGKKGY